MRVRKLYMCGNCNGEGILDDYAFATCPTVCPECEGSGQILVHPDFALGLLLMEKEDVPGASKGSKTKRKNSSAASGRT